MTRNSTPAEILQALGPTFEEDILLAFRFLYYVKAKPAIPDGLYDQLEREYVTRPEVGDDSPLINPGSDVADDYSPRVRALAFYIDVLRWESGQRAGQRSEAEAKQPKQSKQPIQETLF